MHNIYPSWLNTELPPVKNICQSKAKLGCKYSHSLKK